MAKKSLELCVQQIFDGIETKKTVDIGEKGGLKRYNAGVHKIGQNVQYILENYSEHINVLMGLLSHPDFLVADSIALNILGREECTIEQRKLAAATLERLVNGDEMQPGDKMIHRAILWRWEFELRQYENAQKKLTTGVSPRDPEGGGECEMCGQPMHEADGCSWDRIKSGGKWYNRIKYGFEPNSHFGYNENTTEYSRDDGDRCPDCGALPGRFHHGGCEAELCPVCGNQLISCGCSITFVGRYNTMFDAEPYKVHQHENGQNEMTTPLTPQAISDGGECVMCGQFAFNEDGCACDRIKSGDRWYTRIKYGYESDSDFGYDDTTTEYSEDDEDRCHDCGVLPGHFHHGGCDMEQCPVCGNQLISCSCDIVFVCEDGNTFDAEPYKVRM